MYILISFQIKKKNLFLLKIKLLTYSVDVVLSYLTILILHSNINPNLNHECCKNIIDLFYV